ncbi:MAG: serine hydrolase domain-containing protein [Terracidiphilus sp.]|jgi:CubicO group peptidase (beta-lactamase class C family)
MGVPLYNARLESGNLYQQCIFEIYPNHGTFLAGKEAMKATSYYLCAIAVFRGPAQQVQYACSFVYVSAQPGNFFIETPDWSILQNEFNLLNGTLGMTDLAFCQVGDQLWYTGVWLQNSVNQELFHDLTESELEQKRQDLKAKGMILVKALARFSGNQLLYTALFQFYEPTAGNEWGKFDSWAALYDNFKGNSEHHNLFHLHVTQYRGKNHVSATYLPPPTSDSTSIYLLGHRLEEFNTTIQSFLAAGYWVRSLEVIQTPSGWADAFQLAFEPAAVGYSFAVVKDSDLRHPTSGAMGFAIKGAEPPPPYPVQMSENTSLTVGSISKLLDAVSFFYLLQSKKKPLEILNTKFFDLIKGYLGDVKPGKGVKDILVSSLLTHTAGLNDPPGPNYDSVLWGYIKSYVEQDVNPDKTVYGVTGTVFSYSNAAYQTLRGIIWAISGATSYSSYVKDTVLNPLNMDATFMPDPNIPPADVRYYDRNQDPPGGYTIGDVASWSSTPGDLLKLLVELRTESFLSGVYLSSLLSPRHIGFVFNGQHPIPMPGSIAPGFDFAAGAALPPYLSKSGGYNDKSNAQIFRFDEPVVIDVAMQANTNIDKGENPVTHIPDALGVNPGNIIRDTYTMLYCPGI